MGWVSLSLGLGSLNLGYCLSEFGIGFLDRLRLIHADIIEKGVKSQAVSSQNNDVFTYNLLECY